jgi:tryptophanyl-tRNA synthetase
MTRILTGITPSGQPHVGNYFGMMKRAIEMSLQSDTDSFLFVSDLHAFTSHPEPDFFRKNLQTVVLDWLALGLDPDMTTFYRQSDIRAHTELTWLLLCHTPMGLLERAHAYKDKKSNGIDANAGLFTYPILMAADILLYDIEQVPVGKDQKQHVEMARDIAQKFNHHFGETFVLPEAVIDENVQTIPGLDGRKMSKSYKNTIPIFTDKKTLKKSVMSIQTASLELGQAMNPDTCNVFAFHQLFENPRIKALEEDYRAGAIGFGHSKKELVSLIWDYFASARTKRATFEDDPVLVKNILLHGAKKAHTVAEKTLARARKNIGLPEKHLV